MPSPAGPAATADDDAQPRRAADALRSVARSDTGPRQRRLRRVAVVLAASLGSLASVALFWLALSSEYRAAETEFQNRARNFQQTIDDELQSATTLLSTLRAFFESTDVDRSEFERFSKELHGRVIGLRDTAWLPRVTREQRADFEKRARASGAPDFEIRTPDAAGKPGRAGDKAVYYPILFHDSGSAKYGVQGFDLASEPVRRRAIERAIETDGPAATPPITLITVKRPYGGVMGFVPVDAGVGSGPGGTAGRPPRGVVMGIIDIDVMMENILADRARRAGIDVVLFDPAATPDRRLIYWRSARSTPHAAPSEQAILAGTHRQGVVSLLDQRWSIVFAPSEKLETAAWNWHSLMPLVVGLAMTAMVVAYLLVSMRHTGQLEQLTRELRRNAEKISHMARHDSLTGLPNRALFVERMNDAVERLNRGTPFVVLYLDLDHFKAVNDSLGHAGGDRLLLDVAGRLTACVRAVDTVARLGGDEFAVILAETRSEVLVERIATRLVASVGAGYAIDGRTATVGLSIGIAMAPDDGISAEVLLARADRALYAAKSGGRGGFRFHDAGRGAGARQRQPVDAEPARAHPASAAA